MTLYTCKCLTRTGLEMMIISAEGHVSSDANLQCCNDVISCVRLRRKWWICSPAPALPHAHSRARAMPLHSISVKADQLTAPPPQPLSPSSQAPHAPPACATALIKPDTATSQIHFEERIWLQRINIAEKIMSFAISTLNESVHYF